MKRFSTMNHCTYVKSTTDVQLKTPVRTVKVDPDVIDKGVNLDTPLEALGSVSTGIAEIPKVPMHPWRSAKSQGPLLTTEIKDGIKALQTCQAERKKLWAVERQILMRFYNCKVHTHENINVESFQKFLSLNFDKKTTLTYLKEIAVGRKEQLLGIAIGTYSQSQFKPLQRFRCYKPKGNGARDGETFHADKALLGVRPDREEIRRLKECWEIACRESGTKLPETKHINSAVQEMVVRYPELERSSSKNWKEKALKAEARAARAEALVVALRQQIEAMKLPVG